MMAVVAVPATMEVIVATSMQIIVPRDVIEVIAVAVELARVIVIVRRVVIVIVPTTATSIVKTAVVISIAATPIVRRVASVMGIANIDVKPATSDVETKRTGSFGAGSSHAQQHES